MEIALFLSRLQLGPHEKMCVHVPFIDSITALVEFFAFMRWTLSFVFHILSQSIRNCTNVRLLFGVRTVRQI